MRSKGNLFKIVYYQMRCQKSTKKVILGARAHIYFEQTVFRLNSFTSWKMFWMNGRINLWLNSLNAYIVCRKQGVIIICPWNTKKYFSVHRYKIAVLFKISYVLKSIRTLYKIRPCCWKIICSVHIECRRHPSVYIGGHFCKAVVWPYWRDWRVFYQWFHHVFLLLMMAQIVFQNVWHCPI